MSYSYNQPFEHINMESLVDGIMCNGVISGLTVSERGAGQNQSVDVAIGSCNVDGVAYIESGVVNVPLDAAHGTLARKDLVYYDTTAGNPAQVAGTAGASPVPPDIPSGDILLCVVNRSANDNTIANTDIDDGRVYVNNRWVHTSVSTNTTLDDTYQVVSVDASGGARIITLPTAVGIQGKIYVIKKIDSSTNAVTIDGNGAETIDGSTTVVISNQWVSTVIQSNGANWIELNVVKTSMELSDATIILDEFTNTSNITDFDDTTSASGLGDFAGNSVTYDFGENVYMIGVRYKVAYNTQNILNRFTVMSSLDNITYTSAVNATASGVGGGSHDSDEHILRRGRYIRVRVKDDQDPGTNVTWTVYDVQVGVMKI